MSAYKSDFLNILAERGFIHQVSEPDALDARAKDGTLTAYIGYDCTAPSLHIGHLLPTMMLYWLQQTGHRPIALMGGGTTRVGDPSGKDESRKRAHRTTSSTRTSHRSARPSRSSSSSRATAATPSWPTMPTG